MRVPSRKPRGEVHARRTKGGGRNPSHRRGRRLGDGQRVKASAGIIDHERGLARVYETSPGAPHGRASSRLPRAAGRSGFGHHADSTDAHAHMHTRVDHAKVSSSTPRPHLRPNLHPPRARR